jgi:hypothetical protein
MFDHLLAEDAILLARQFCDCLRDRSYYFICFNGIDFGRACRWIFGEEIVDHFDNHAVEAGAFLFIFWFCHD